MKYSEISHFNHPQHVLKFEYSEFPFKCDGCKEVGIGSKYKCTKCDFDLHMHCAIPSATIIHPFYTKCSFQFYSRPPGDKPRYCNACERDVSGFVYHCKDCGFDLHPCCAKLPMVLNDGEVKLNLYRKVSATCHKCGRKGRSWSYRSSCKKYNLHVACVKDMLVENWYDLYIGQSTYGKPNCNHNHGYDYSYSYTNRNNSNNFNNNYNNNNNNSFNTDNNNNIYNRKLENRIPSLKNTLQTHKHSKSKGKVQKCCEIAGMCMQFVISAVLGDPTTVIAGVIGSLM